MNTDHASETAYCIRCGDDAMPVGFLCRRGSVTDHGADRDAELTARYEGRCIRCCGHNHG